MPPFALVDAFTDGPFRGNPAGVVVLERAAPEAWMAAVAAEVNASETAFVHPAAEGWALRWFTPTVEVDLCGHATLATAHVLWTTGAASGRLRFTTRSGVLTASRDGEVSPGQAAAEGTSAGGGDDDGVDGGDGDGAEDAGGSAGGAGGARGDGHRGRIWLDLPAWPLADHPAPPDLADALAGTAHTYLGRTAGAQPNDVVEVADEATLRRVEPDLALVGALGSTGLIVTAAGTGGVDLVSRYFAPAVGVDEDPVTGSAHSTLGPLWAERLGRSELLARQVSARGGELHLRVGIDRVAVGGSAVTVIAGEVLPPDADGG